MIRFVLTPNVSPYIHTNIACGLCCSNDGEWFLYIVFIHIKSRGTYAWTVKPLKIPAQDWAFFCFELKWFFISEIRIFQKCLPFVLLLTSNRRGNPQSEYSDLGTKKKHFANYPESGHDFLCGYIIIHAGLYCNNMYSGLFLLDQEPLNIKHFQTLFG